MAQNNKRRVAAWAMIILFEGMSLPVMAGQVEDSMRSMWTSLSVTNAQSFRTPNYHGMSGGSMTMRWGAKNYNIIAFDPPRLNAGCSGIDMYLGSFSFINAEQFKNMMRGIAQGVVGFAFKAAIKSMCETCGAVMDKLEEAMRAINALGKNTCAIAKGVVDIGKDLMAEDTKTQQAAVNRATKTVGDYFESIKTPMQQASTLAQRNWSGGTSDGNVLYKAIYKSRAMELIGDNSVTYGMGGNIMELAMNMVGTPIVKFQAGASADVNEDPIKPMEVGGHINVKELIDGFENGKPLPYWMCDTKTNDPMGCEAPRLKVDAKPFMGSRAAVMSMIYGGTDPSGWNNASAQDGSIYHLLSSGRAAELSSAQMALLNTFRGLNIPKIFYDLQGDKNTIDLIMKDTVEVVARQLAVDTADQVIKMVKVAFGTSDESMPTKHVKVDERLKELQLQLNAMRDDELTTKRLEYVKRVDDIRKAVLESTPKAMISTVARPQ